MPISIKDAIKFIRETHGLVFAVEFVKRSTGEIRTMICRTGVRRYVSGEGMAYDPTEHDLITVFDMNAVKTDAERDRASGLIGQEAPEQGAYRSISIEGIQRIKINGEWQDVVH